MVKSYDSFNLKHSATQLHPKECKKISQIWSSNSNGYNISAGNISIISLYEANNGKFVVLDCDKNGQIKPVEVESNNLDSKFAWKLVEINFNIPGPSPGAGMLVKHLRTGLYLTVENDIPVGRKYKEVDINELSPFIWGNRFTDRDFLYLGDPTQKYYCGPNTPEGTGLVVNQETVCSNNGIFITDGSSCDKWSSCDSGTDTKPPGYCLKNVSSQTISSTNNSSSLQSALNNELLGGTSCKNFNCTWPINGKPYIRIYKTDEGKWGVKMSGVLNQNYNITRINDKENEWYCLPMNSNDNDSLPSPITRSWSVQQMLNWDPTLDYNAPYCKSRTKLKERIVDPLTQANPNMIYGPHKLILSVSNLPEGNMCCQSIAHPYTYNFQFWNSIDYIIFGTNDQGWAPLEFKKLQVPKCCGFNSNVSLHELLDGSRSGGPSQIFIPPRYFIENAHEHGVKILGSIFFQEMYYGAKWTWFEKFCNNYEETAKKLVDMAIYYGIDGYFLDNESIPNGYVASRKKNETDSFKTNNIDQKDCSNAYASTRCVDINKNFEDIENEQYWCHYYRRGQGAYWCNQAPCSRCDFVGFNSGDNDIAKNVYNNLIKLGKAFRSYAKSKNSNIQLILYESMNNNGNISYFGGINEDNSNIWATPEGQTFDGILTMNESNSIEPVGQTATYMRTAESVNGCKDDSINKGWPSGLGPSYTQNNSLQPNMKCTPNIIESYNDKCTVTNYIDCNKTNETDCNNDNCCWDPEGSKAGKHPFWCYKSNNNDQLPNVSDVCDKCIIPDNMIDVYKKFDSNQSYNFFATFVEGLSTNVSIGNESITGDAKLSQQTTGSWLTDFYCGKQNCGDMQKRVGLEPPLTSLSLYGSGQFNPQKSWDWNVIATSGAFYPPDRQLPGTAAVPTGSVYYPMCYIFPERSTLNTLPFYTSFDMGQGRNFYIEGILQESYGSYCDYIQTQQPTFMFWPSIKNSGIIGMITPDAPYNSGTSLKFKCLSGSKDTEFNLFKTHWDMKNDIVISAHVKIDEFINPPEGLKIGIGYWYIDNKNVLNKVNCVLNKVSTKWEKISISVPKNNGYIGIISIGISGTDCDGVCYIGDISVSNDVSYNFKPSDITIKTSSSNQTLLKWETNPNVLIYYIYNNHEFLGRIKNGDSNEKILYNIQDSNKFKKLRVRGLLKDGKLSHFSNYTTNSIIYPIVLLLLLLLGLGLTFDMKKPFILCTGLFLFFITTIILITYKNNNISKYIQLLLITGIIILLLKYITDPTSTLEIKIISISLLIILIIAIIITKNNCYSLKIIPDWKQTYVMQLVDINQQPYPISKTLVKARHDLQKDAYKKYNYIKKYNKQLASLFYNSYMCCMLYCISSLDNNLSYTITGNWGKDQPLHSGTNMGGMWVRDAVLQAKSYINISIKSVNVRYVVKGILNQCIDFGLLNSYSNAFNASPQFPNESDYSNGTQGITTTANYEMDGLCFLFLVITEYCKKTKDYTILSDKCILMFNKFITQLQYEQHRYSFQLKMGPTDNMKLVGNDSMTNQTVYRFSEMANGGIGSYVSKLTNGKGMSYTAFRPSDDIAIFGYNIPDNMLAVSAINKMCHLLTNHSHNNLTINNIIRQAKALEKSIDAAINELGIFNHPEFGKIYAYEIDGLGEDQFLGDGVKNLFTLNGSISSDCNLYSQKDQFGTDTGCNPYYPYYDKTVRQQPPDNNQCSNNPTVINPITGDPRMVGSRMLEILIDGIPVPINQINLNGRDLSFTTPPPKDSLISVKGNFNLMDDANLPSLLSIPWTDYTGSAWNQEIYNNTRKFCLSNSNRWYYNYGSTGINGIGSGHTFKSTGANTPGLVWPMSIISKGITGLKFNNTTEEISNTVSMLLMSSNVDLVNTGIGISPVSISPYQAPNYIHESVWVTNTNKYTRGFFGWCNAYFSEFILNILDNNNCTSILSKVKLTGVNTIC